MLLSNWRIFDEPSLDNYFYTTEQQGTAVAIANNAASRDALAYAPKTLPLEAPETPTEKAKAEGVVMFSQWLERTAPELYKRILMTVPEELIPEFALAGMRFSGLAEEPANPDAPQTSWGDRVATLIETWLPQYAAYRSQRELMRLNISRAERGLPPLESADIAPQVRVGMTTDTQRLVMIGGIAVVAVLLLKR